MYNPNRRGMNTSIPMSTSLPPPASVSSGTTFVSRFLLGAIAIVATIGLILAAPLSVTGPLGFVFLAGLSGTFLLSALERRRQRRDRSSRLPGRVTGAHDASSRDADPAGRTPSASGALAIFSISMLGVALFAPVSLGVGVAVVGLVGLFALRISAMVTGWAPRGAAWAGPRRSNPLPALG